MSYMTMAFLAGMMLGVGTSAAAFGWAYVKDKRRLSKLESRIEILEYLRRTTHTE